MEIGKTLYVVDRKAWRQWLSKNYKSEKEIWLIYYKKSSGKPRIPYNDAVEEALCFGWIDSTVKSIDGEKYAQRFTPRRSGSVLSDANKERLRKLVANKKMTRAGLAAVSHAFKAGAREKFAIAKDVLAVVRKDKEAWKNFQRLPQGYKRVRIGYIEGQRLHSKQAFQKSLDNFVRKTAKNKKFGFVMQ